MKHNLLIVGLLGLMLASCGNIPESDPEKVYQYLEETAIVHITETFEAMPTNTPTEVPTATPTEEPTATLQLIAPVSNMIQNVAPAAPTATVVFPDRADFVSALPSPNQFLPGQKFMTTWSIKNIGTTTWTGKYRFYHTDGPRLADYDEYTISKDVKPGETLDIVMPATAPNAEGTYTSTWTLANPEGIVFYNIYYVAIVGDKTFITALPGEDATATPAGTWWMCTDKDRSILQGHGCADYCNAEVVQMLAAEGKKCYSYGEVVQ